MINLFVFVEGEYDVMFIEKILFKHFHQNKSTILIPIPYQKKANIKIIKHIKKIESREGEEYIFLSDFDSHSYNCVTARKEKRIKEFHHDQYNDLDYEKIFIVIDEIESWFISGVNNSLKPFDNIDIPDNTESFTKEKFDKMIKNSKFSSKIDFLMELSNVYDFSLAIERNNSFKYFFEKMNLLDSI